MPNSPALAPIRTRTLRAAAIAGIVARNAVPVAGMLFLGWRASHLVLLYYVDTLAALASLFVLVMMFAKGMGVDMRKPADVGKVLFSAAVLTAVFGFVLSIPLLATAATDEIVMDEALEAALLVQLLFGAVAFLTMSHEMRRAADPEPLIKARFGFVFVRWVAVFAVCTTIPWAPLLVLTYVVASVWLEIRPLPPDGLA